MPVIEAVAEQSADVEDLAFDRVAARFAPASTLAAWRRTMADDAGTGGHAAVHLDNSAEHAALLFFLLGRGITPVVLAPDSPPEEAGAAGRKVGASCVLRLDDANNLVIDRLGTPPAAGARPQASGAAGIYLLTSGSMGAAATVFRSVASWRDEARRYLQLLRLGAADHVLLASPICHAYGLGWLWAAAEAGCSLEACRPTHLSAMAEALRMRATHCALTPVCASLLARRAGEGARPMQLQVAMAGAGPVDDAVDAAFRRAFGLGLSRNYGSTETGALFASTISLPALHIGWPMPNVRIRSSAPRGEAFLLVVELEDGRVVEMGDILCEEEAGFRIIGRETSSIRRGESWVSPFEIESVLRLSPKVADCHVRSVKSRIHAGNDHIVASVVASTDAEWDQTELRRFCAERLRPGKVPDVIERVDAIVRASTGKPMRSPVYRWAGAAEVVAAAGAYKESLVVFGLVEAIGLARLNGERSVDEIAYEAGVHAGTLGELLHVAERLGLVEKAAAPVPGPLDESVLDMVMLERDASRLWNTVDGLSAVVRHGRLDRPFDAAPASPAFRDRYLKAMNGPHKRRAAHLVRRHLRRLLVAPYRLLDVSATGGGYATRWRDEGVLAQATCIPVGIAGTLDDHATDLHLTTLDEILCGGACYNLIVFDNAVHDRHVAAHLPQLIEVLAPEGAIVIDDLFLNQGPGSGIGVDWLTHGGMACPTQDSVDRVLADLGFAKHEVTAAERPVCHSVNIYTRT